MLKYIRQDNKSPVARTFRASVSSLLKIKEEIGEGRVIVQKWLAGEKNHAYKC